MKERIVFAYAGVGETWAEIASIAEGRAAEIVTVTLDLGQGSDLEEVRDRALAAGAARAHVLDVREEFARDYVLPALQAGALRGGRDPMALDLAGPLIGRKLMEIASIEGARDVVDSSGMQANLWGRQGASYRLTKSPEDAPETPAGVEVSFARGVPDAVNGVPMALTELIEILSIIAGHHGVGRIDASETCSEAPAAVVLHAAHNALETLVSPPELMRRKRESAVEYAALVSQGLWFTPRRETLDAFNARAQEQVTGSVRIKLLKGLHTIVECQSTVPQL